MRLLKTVATLAVLGFWGGLLPGAGLAQDGALHIPDQRRDDALHARLPEAIRKAGKIISVNNGSFPPYQIIVDAQHATGAVQDLSKALGQLLGVTIEHVSVNSFAAELAGVSSGRYDLAMGPNGDYKPRRVSFDYIDYVREYVVFAVRKGNPAAIDGLDDACGKRVAVMSAGSAEKVITTQSEKCVTDGKGAVEILSFSDQPSAILAVRSKRADAFFSSQAPLTYFVQQAQGDLELTALGKDNGFSNLVQGVLLPKESPMRDVLFDGFKQLNANGTLAAIFKKWGIEKNRLAEPGINLGTD